jgi:hypothetical protein
MTHGKPEQLAHLLEQVMTTIGYKRAADIVGRSVNHLYKWSSRNDPALPNLMQFLLLEAEHVRLTGEAAVMPHLSRWMEAIKREDQARVDSVAKELMDVTMSIGVLAGHCSKSLEDGKISPGEASAFLTQTSALRQEINEVEQAVLLHAQGATN